MNASRRQFVKWSALLAASSAIAISPACLFAADAPRKRVLFYTKSANYEHSVVHRKDGALGLAEQLLTDWGKTIGVEVVASKDGRLFESQKELSTFDGFALYTCGDLFQLGKDNQPPMTPTGKAALIDAVKSGKGVIGMHSTSDTFHAADKSIDPYLAMIGGEFIVHGSQQKSTLKVIDKNFPGVSNDGEITLTEEWYALKNFAPDLHVIFTQQPAGMKGWMYQRPPYPSTWARMHGKGRVFYTSLGHREDVWTSAMYQSLITGALRWSLGLVDADLTPNLKEAAPQASDYPTTHPTK